MSKPTDYATARLTAYVTAGCTPTQALDLFMVNDQGMSARAWASIRGCDTVGAVEKSVTDACEHGGLDADDVLGRDA